MGVPNRTSVIVSDAAKSKDPKQITLNIVIPDALTGKHRRHRRHSRSHNRQRNDNDTLSEVSSDATSKPPPPVFVGGQDRWASGANTWVVGDRSPTADDSASQVRGETSAISEASVDISNEASRDASRGKEASEDISSGNEDNSGDKEDNSSGNEDNSGGKEDNSGGNEASEDFPTGNEARVDKAVQAEPEEAAFATLANFE